MASAARIAADLWMADDDQRQRAEDAARRWEAEATAILTSIPRDRLPVEFGGSAVWRRV